MSTSEIATVGQEIEFAYSSTQVIQAMREDMDFFAGTILPLDCTLSFPAEYRWIWAQLISLIFLERDFTKLALGLPRGHGKTQVVKLFIVFCILFSPKRYILIIGATLEKAEAILSDVAAMLDSENVQTLFGNWRYDLEIDRADLKAFSFQGRKVILQAAGTGTSIRGTNRGQARPDLMVFDDSQTAKCAESLTESKAYHSWFSGTAMKAKSPKGCTFIYIGNMYRDMEMVQGTGNYTCLLRMLQKSPSWITFIVGAILNDGTALWEELFPIAQLLQEYEDDKLLQQEAIFMAEVLNNPSGSKSHYVDTEKFVVMRNRKEFPHQGNFIVIDPATNKQTPDMMSIMYYEIYDNRPTCVEIRAEKFSGPQSVAAGLDMAVRNQCSLIVVEDNAYQHSLCNWFDFVIEQQQIIGIQVVGMSSSSNKNGRILRIFKSLMSDEIRLTPETKAQVEHQAIHFDPTKTNNLDDILDNLTLAERAALELRHLMHIPGDLAENAQSLIANQSQEDYHIPSAGF